MLMRFLRKIRCAFILLRVGAFKVFLDQLRHQIYSRDIHIGLVKSLDNLEKNHIECPIKYHLRDASKEDMNEAFQKVKTESKESAQMLLKRKWLYECGCGKWFVARTAETDELCYLQCVITPEDNELLDKGFKKLFTRLKEDEILMEGTYTFEKYRGNTLAGSALFNLIEIYQNKGFKRVIGYIDKDRKSQLKRNEGRGFTRFEEVSLTKIMFFNKRKSKPYRQPGETPKIWYQLKKRIKNLAKRSQLIVRLYRPIKFLHIFSGKDLLNLVKDIGKTRLILTVRHYTMMDYPPLSALYESAFRCERTKTGGSFVECGVRNGGSAAVIAAAAKKNINRHVWLFDSWEGFPEPDERDITYELKRAKKGGCLGFEETARELLFNRLQLDSTRVHLVKGWFADTLPQKETGPIAMLHLDCDLYESVRFCLEQLYDDVINGGCIFIDDYRYYKGCQEAVDEFINCRNLKVKLLEYSGYGVYFHKES